MPDQIITPAPAGDLGGASDVITLDGRMQVDRDKHSVYLYSSAAPRQRLIVSPREWDDFIAGVKAGDFDNLSVP